MLLDQLEEHIQALERRIRERIASLGWVRLLKTLPGVGTILGSTIYLEIGEISRFPDAAHLAAMRAWFRPCIPAAVSAGKDRRRARPTIF